MTVQSTESASSPDSSNIHDHVAKSVGGMGGHLLRRSVHLSIIIIPTLFYWWGDNIAVFLDLKLIMIPSIIGFTVLFLEAIRLRLGLVVYGQREYESAQPSAMFWGFFAICLTLIIAPQHGVSGAAYGAPIIWCLAIVDPALGEARRSEFDEKNVMIFGFFLAMLIWLFAAFALGTPAWLAPIMAAITIVAERPRLKWLDDNGAMVLAPLSIITLLGPFL